MASPSRAPERVTSTSVPRWPPTGRIARQAGRGRRSDAGARAEQQRRGGVEQSAGAHGGCSWRGAVGRVVSGGRSRLGDADVRHSRAVEASPSGLASASDPAGRRVASARGRRLGRRQASSSLTTLPPSTISIGRLPGAISSLSATMPELVVDGGGEVLGADRVAFGLAGRGVGRPWM